MSHDTERDEETGRVIVKDGPREKAEQHKQRAEEAEQESNFDSAPNYVTCLYERQQEILNRLAAIEEEL